MKITDKKKTYLIVASVNAILIAYLVLLMFGFKKLLGHDDPKGYQVLLTNQIINNQSSLDSDNTFWYKNMTDRGEEVTRFSCSKLSDASIGGYEPNTYIYGSETSNTIYVSFKLNNKKVDKVVFNKLYLSDMDGENIMPISRSEYKYSSKDGFYTMGYSSKDTPKYIYSVYLTYYLR